MPRGGAHFSSEELARVISHYDIGVIHQAKAFSAGSKRTPKVVITADSGKFLLKRRPKGRDDFYRAAFAHAVQTHLAGCGFNVPSLLATCDQKSTILQIDNHIYELYSFITGNRYNGSAEATIDAGRQLAKFHLSLADFVSEWTPVESSFHDSSTVRRHLKTAGTIKKPLSRHRHLRRTVDMLMTLYNAASVSVNELGFDHLEQQIVHGDWHPGNILFSDYKVTAVLDFGSVRIAPDVTDIANAMLQFSIVGNRPNPADWPDYLDQARLIQFLSGYRQVIRLEQHKLDCLLDLMIETIIAEAVLPVAATGFFGHLSGADFLKMIHRKARWINANRKTLTEAIKHQP